MDRETLFNELISQVEKPTKLILGEKIYKKWCADYKINQLDDPSIKFFHTEKGQILVEVVPEDVIKVI